MGEMGVRHIVATRGSVTSVYVDAVYFSLATCHPKAVSGLVVSLGSFVKPTYVALAQTTCSGVASSSTRLIN
jgi:hypothetical protein